MLSARGCAANERMVVVPPNAADTVPEWKSSAHITPMPEICSMWQWLSMPPGSTQRPAASTSRVLAASFGAISTITPLRTPMSAWKVPSALLIRPLRIVRSKEVSVMAWRAESRSGAKHRGTAGSAPAGRTQPDRGGLGGLGRRGRRMGSAWNGDRNRRVWRQLFRRPLALSRDTLTAMINIQLSLLRRNPETLACHHTLQHVDESLRQLRHRLGAQPHQRGFEHRRVEHRAHHELARGPTAGRELVDQRDARARLHQRAGVLPRASPDHPPRRPPPGGPGGRAFCGEPASIAARTVSPLASNSAPTIAPKGESRSYEISGNGSRSATESVARRASGWL